MTDSRYLDPDALPDLVEALQHCLAGLRYAERGETGGTAKLMRADIARGEAALAKAKAKP